MNRKCSTPAVPFRHGYWRLVPLFAVFAIALGASNPPLTIQVSTETAPPGGYAQFKIYASPPALISAASVILNLDPTIFGPIASINAFSANGDQIGFSSNPVSIGYVTSASASLGQLPGLPIFTVTAPVLATAKIGTAAPQPCRWSQQFPHPRVDRPRRPQRAIHLHKRFIGRRPGSRRQCRRLDQQPHEPGLAR